MAGKSFKRFGEIRVGVKSCHKTNFIHRHFLLFHEPYGILNLYVSDELSRRLVGEAFQFSVEVTAADCKLGSQIIYSEVGILQVLFNRVGSFLNQFFVEVEAGN